MNDRVFTDRIRAWGQQIREKNKRGLPWLGERDPYRIWLSETLLQQTRVEQGLPYYHAFLEAFPTVRDLAAAPEDRVLKLWEGLGYYSRARNLLKAAQMVVRDFDGRFPESLEGLRRLPGVGAYTAAAVASFAFGLPHAVLDGNVYRVLARFYDLDLEVPGTAAQKLFAHRANAVLDRLDPAAWNQAIMDFGALVCTPRKPDCAHCPVADHCGALLNGTVLERPVKKAKKPKRLRVLHFLRLDRAGEVLVERRDNTGIWAGLWQFPLWEAPAGEGPQAPRPDDLAGLDPKASAQQALHGLGIDAGHWSYRGSSGPLRHLLSHQDIRAWVHRFEPAPALAAKGGRGRKGALNGVGGEKSAERGKVAGLSETLDRQWIAHAQLRSLAFPRVLTRHLETTDA